MKRIMSVLGTIITSILSLGIEEAWLIIFAGFIYLLGVQGITISIHLPLNKHIQKIDINSTNSQTLSEVRKNFETKWNYFNNIRTGIALFGCSDFSFNINYALINDTVIIDIEM